MALTPTPTQSSSSMLENKASGDFSALETTSDLFKDGTELMEAGSLTSVHICGAALM